jgi:predicted alpha/beta hydrolase
MFFQFEAAHTARMQTTFGAVDGFSLRGEFYGDASLAKAAVLIAPAMGVSQRYYADFSRWLADHGYLVLSFDYRGIGVSRPEEMKHSLRGLNANVHTWAKYDAAAALEHLHDTLAAAGKRERPIHWVGHSLGGQILGLLPNHAHIDRAVTVGAGSGYWRENADSLRTYVWWLWYVLVPVCLPLFGYFPGRRLRKVGDLPRGVMEQWRRWCLDRDYMMGEGGCELRRQYAALTLPLLSVSFTDDEFMSRRNIESLHSFYSGTQLEMWRMQPEDTGQKRIGHFGFFQSRCQSDLWPRVANWLA